MLHAWRLVLLILYLTCRPFGAPAQIPRLLEKDKTWIVEYADRISLPPDIQQLTYAYTGDTVIAAVTYGLFGNGAILREDTLLRRVYAYDGAPEDTQDCLLYDFAANPGDTLELCHGFQIVIDSVSRTLLNNGEERTIFYYTGGINGAYYIEGIGSNLGFIEISEAIGPPGLELMCVRKNGTELYGNRCNEVISNVLDAGGRLSSITVYPNPTAGDITIETEMEIGHFQLIDLQGHVILEEKPKGSTLQIGQVRAGLYYLILFDRRAKLIGMKKVAIIE